MTSNRLSNGSDLTVPSRWAVPRRVRRSRCDVIAAPDSPTISTLEPAGSPLFLRRFVEAGPSYTEESTSLTAAAVYADSNARRLRTSALRKVAPNLIRKNIESISKGGDGEDQTDVVKRSGTGAYCGRPFCHGGCARLSAATATVPTITFSTSASRVVKVIPARGVGLRPVLARCRRMQWRVHGSRGMRHHRKCPNYRDVKRHLQHGV